MLSLLPDNISLLKGLKKLMLWGSKLHSFPESLRLSFGDLTELDELDLDGTPLETLPDSIGKLSKLSILSLSDTQLSILLETIGDLPVLRRLHLPYTTLQSVPQRLTQLSRLTHFKIDIGALFKSLESERARSKGVDRATIDWPSESVIHAFLHQAVPSQAMTNLTLSGRGYPQSWILPLFLHSKKVTSLNLLRMFDFNLVETIPCKLGELTSLRMLVITRCKKLRQLPESLGKLSKLGNLQLIDVPSLCRLPESLSASSSLYALKVMNCGSLQTMPCSLNHLSNLERKSSTSECNGCRLSDSLERMSPPQLQSDSWGLVESFLECWGKHFSENIECQAECKEFEKAIKMAKMCGTQEYEIQTKIL